MKLEELVPSLELCRLIPEGEFEDSCFIWSYSCDKRKTEPFVDYRDEVEFCRRNMVNTPIVHPAPTFVEIIDDLPVWEVQEELLYAFDRTERALKMWLKLKGIEYKKIKKNTVRFANLRKNINAEL